MTHSSPGPAEPAAIPMWIPTPGGHAFAWYHPPSPQATRACAVLFCYPFGVDRMILHITYRHLALRLAELGFPVLRVDYPGTCDSEGSPRNSVRIETWLDCLDVAANKLKEWSGCQELALFGVLLGGTLGVLLSGRRSDVTGLVLWGPYLQGRTAVRTMVAATTAGNANPTGKRPSSAMPGDKEALGYLLTKGMIEDMESIDLLRTQPKALRRAFVIKRTDTSPEPKLAAHLASTSLLAQHLASIGTNVKLQDKSNDDLQEVLQTGDYKVPERTIEDIADWLILGYPRLEARRSVERLQLCPAEVLLHEPGQAQVRESAVYLGTDERVFGILSEAAGPARRAPAALMLNWGRNHRPGNNRNATELARSLAARGHSVLRIDVCGLGDSKAPRPDLVGALHLDEQCKDVLDAANWLRARGAGSVACAGLCAGAYLSFQAALRNPSIMSIVMLNTLRFHDELLEDTGGDVFHADRWRQAAREGFSVRVLARRGRSLMQKILRRFLPWTSPAGRNARKVAQSFVQLAKRGVDVCIVYNENELHLNFLRQALQSVLRRLESSGRFRILTVGHANHIFSPLWAQEEVRNIVLGHFEKLAARAPTDGQFAASTAETGAMRSGSRLQQR